MKKFEKLKIGWGSPSTENIASESVRTILRDGSNERCIMTQSYGTTSSRDTGWFLNWDYEVSPDIKYGDVYCITFK